MWWRRVYRRRYGDTPKAEGYFVRVADIREHEFLDMRNLVDEVLVGDLCDSIFADEVCAGGVDELYQFAADGGRGLYFHWRERRKCHA